MKSDLFPGIHEQNPLCRRADSKQLKVSPTVAKFLSIASHGTAKEAGICNLFFTLASMSNSILQGILFKFEKYKGAKAFICWGNMLKPFNLQPHIG